jgi:hypothetical protein
MKKSSTGALDLSCPLEEMYAAAATYSKRGGGCFLDLQLLIVLYLYKAVNSSVYNVQEMVKMQLA